MISSRQRRLVENTGVFDPSNAQPGTVTPPAPSAPPAPAIPQDSAPSVSVNNNTPEIDKAENLTAAQGMLDDIQAQLSDITAKVGIADSGTAELLAKFSGELVEIRNAVATKIQKLGPSVDADATQENGVQLPQIPEQPAPPAPAPLPPTTAPAQQPALEGKNMNPNDDDFVINYGSPQKYGYIQKAGKWVLPEDAFKAQLNNVFGEDGVTKERPKTSQEMDEVIQRTKHQGPQKGKTPKTHGKSEADFAAKDVEGHGYGSDGGIS